MKKQEELKLTGEVKIIKTYPVIPSLSGDLKTAAGVIKKGGVIIFPTDTVYGIGCRINDQKAINRIYKIKKTPKKQMFPTLISNINQVKELANISPIAQNLIKKYWPGQLTIIIKAKNGQKTGFRMPNSKLVRSLINESNTPIIGTSANFHGANTPVSYNDLDENFVKKADFVLKGQCEKKIESTVVDLTVNPPVILRHGAVTINDLKN